MEDSFYPDNVCTFYGYEIVEPVKMKEVSTGLMCTFGACSQKKNGIRNKIFCTGFDSVAKQIQAMNLQKGDVLNITAEQISYVVSNTDTKTGTSKPEIRKNYKISYFKVFRKKEKPEEKESAVSTPTITDGFLNYVQEIRNRK